MKHLVACSVSRPILERLRQPGWSGSVVADSANACCLATPEGDLICLVLPELGNGPLSVVLDAGQRDLEGLKPGQGAAMQGSALRVGPIAVSLEGALAWEPSPDWTRLRALLARSKHTDTGLRLAQVREAAWLHATSGSLLDPVLAVGGAPPSGQPPDPLLVLTWQAATRLQLHRWDDRAGLEEAAAGLAGLGRGLTPAGDDFLAGAMLWLWWAHPDTASQTCGCLLRAAAPRTTLLSARLLASAAKGQCSEGWHGLLAALAGGDGEAIGTAVRRVVEQGATSGADALAGFLYSAASGI